MRIRDSLHLLYAATNPQKCHWFVWNREGGGGGRNRQVRISAQTACFGGFGEAFSGDRLFAGPGEQCAPGQAEAVMIRAPHPKGEGFFVPVQTQERSKQNETTTQNHPPSGRFAGGGNAGSRDIGHRSQRSGAGHGFPGGTNCRSRSGIPHGKLPFHRLFRQRFGHRAAAVPQRTAPGRRDCGGLPHFG